MKILSNFNSDFYSILFMVTFLYLFYYILPIFIDFDMSFLLIAIFSSLIAIIIMYREGYLSRITFYSNNSLYYGMLLFLVLNIIPKEWDLVLKVIYYNGIREELFFRFFMLGVFMKYFKDSNFSSNINIITIYAYTNFLYLWYGAPGGI
jgi:hypothetical protein